MSGQWDSGGGGSDPAIMHCNAHPTLIMTYGRFDRIVLQQRRKGEDVGSCAPSTPCPLALKPGRRYLSETPVGATGSRGAVVAYFVPSPTPFRPACSCSPTSAARVPPSQSPLLGPASVSSTSPWSSERHSSRCAMDILHDSATSVCDKQTSLALVIPLGEAEAPHERTTSDTP
jgi:hypothetical protein